MRSVGSRTTLPSQFRNVVRMIIFGVEKGSKTPRASMVSSVSFVFSMINTGHKIVFHLIDPHPTEVARS